MLSQARQLQRHIPLLYPYAVGHKLIEYTKLYMLFVIRHTKYKYKIATFSDVLHSQGMSPTRPPEQGSRALQRRAPCHLAAC